MLYQNEIAVMAERDGLTQFTIDKDSFLKFPTEIKASVLTQFTIDKDWVLGHFVHAIFSNDYFKDVLVFKGGTCMRNCYFQNYRFSEDLDFTVCNTARLAELTKLCRQIENNAGIWLHIHTVKELQFNNMKTGY